MREYVLFSPIGSTDPIRDDFDGPMLHIARYYKPKKVYLFFTAEMSKRDYKDNIYEWTLHQLDPSIQIEKIYHEDITDPQIMDKFDEYYPKDIEKIYKENPTCQIIANITSGTAQMMTSIRIFAAQADFPIKLIAVDTPAKKSNHSRPVDDNYDKVLSWKNDFDNETDNKEVICRCKEIKHDNIKKAIIKSIIEKYIEVYDYKGAIMALKQAPYFFDNKLPEVLHGADYRLHLEHNKAQMSFNNTNVGYEDVYPVQSSDCRDIFEYILHLQKLGEREYLLEFAQGFSPLLFRLSYSFLKRTLKVPINEYIRADKKNVKYYVEVKLPDKYKTELIKKFHIVNYKTPLNTANLLPIIKYEATQQKKLDGYKKINRLREFEESVRNIAAHEIIAISKETFKTNAETTWEKIIADFKFLYQIIFHGTVDWNSYDAMNEKIMQYLR